MRARIVYSTRHPHWHSLDVLVAALFLASFAQLKITLRLSGHSRLMHICTGEEDIKTIAFAGVDVCKPSDFLLIRALNQNDDAYPQDTILTGDTKSKTARPNTLSRPPSNTPRSMTPTHFQCSTLLQTTPPPQ